MAIANPLFPSGANGLEQLFAQGLSVVGSAINNSISTGRDRAAMQFGQERDTFQQIQQARDNARRKALDIQQAMENNRLFGRTLARDVRSDFESNRNFAQREQQLAFERAQAERNFALNSATAVAGMQRADRSLALQETGAMQSEVERNLRIAGLLEEQKTREEMRGREESFRTRALEDPVADILTSQDTPRGVIPDSELLRFATTYAASPDPEVRGAVRSAQQEYAMRNPDIDPETGKAIPSKFAPDRDDPFSVAKTPEEVKIIAQQLQDEIAEYTTALSTARGSVKSTLTREISKRQEQLRKAPVSIQQEVSRQPGSVPSTQPPATRSTSAKAALDMLLSK